MSFNPDEDGHIVWDYGHTMAANATSKIKRERYVSWLNSLKDVFPCEKCRKHLIVNLNKFPVEPYMGTNVALFYHSWKLHDIVNGQLNKPDAQRLTYEQAYAIYFKTKENAGTHKVQAYNTTEDYQRYIVAAGKNEADKPLAGSCTGCQEEIIEEIKIPTYTEHKKAQRVKYLPKN